MPTYDVTIIGAGIIGLATARALLQRQPRLRLVVLDKEPAIAAHQTGHNSGVIHSGVYYAPGTLKARLCVQGSRDLYAYCDSRGITAERCGKVIVAADERELPRLDELYRRGVANGVPGLELIGPKRLREIEPYCAGVRALWVPSTGIVDYGRVAAAYADDLRASGGEVRVGSGVRAIRNVPESVVLQTESGDVKTRFLIACAGLQADRVAQLSGAPVEPRIVPFRGDYWLLRPERRYLARNLIYPVPDPAFPFLGVHFTRRSEDGAVWLGPNAVLAFAREGYRRLHTNPADLVEVVGYPGFRRMASKFWRTGLMELHRDFSKRAFLQSLQRYIPALSIADLIPGPSGVRAQALDRSGRLVDDFVVNVQDGRIIHVRNAPSPGATSSLAIGRLIAERAAEAFGWGGRRAGPGD
jgi:L-2-hydroxyglutarate oxidase LhgO